MSSAPTPPAAPTPAGSPPPGTPANAETSITLISHSMLFYWWPIWFLGLIMALVTYFEDHRLAILPNKSTVVVDTAKSDDKNTVYQLITPKGETRSLKHAEEATQKPSEGDTFPARVSQKTWLGPLFCVVL